MKSKKWAALLAVLGIGGMLLVSYPAVSSATAAPTGAKGAGIGQAMGRWSGGMVDTIAKLLGMDRTEIIQERQAGKSMVDIAKSKGVDEDKLVSTVVEERKAILDQRVKDGLVTEEQAQYCTENMEQRIEANMNRTTVGPANGFGKMRGGRGAGAGQGFGGIGCGMGAGYCQGYSAAQ